MARKAKIVQEELEEELPEVEETEEELPEVEEEELEEDSAAASTLHPGAGSNAGTEPSHMEKIASVMHYLANKEVLNKYYDGMMKTFGNDFGIPGGWSEKNKNTIKAKPSDAVGHGGGADTIKEPFGGGGAQNPNHTQVKEAIKSEVAALFEGQELTPEFKEKATILFEASLEARVAEVAAQFEEEYEERLADELEEINEKLTGDVETYIEYVAEEWMKQNEVAIESSLRNEITTEFMEKLRELFIESNVNIPEDQVEVVDALAEKVEELESRLAEAIQEVAELRGFKEAADAAEAIEEAAEGLTLVDAEKLRTLAESVDAEDMEEFSKKLTVIRESFEKPKKSTVSTLMEEVDEDNQLGDEKPQAVDPSMRPYLEAIERTVKSNNG